MVFDTDAGYYWCAICDEARQWYGACEGLHQDGLAYQQELSLRRQTLEGHDEVDDYKNWVIWKSQILTDYSEEEPQSGQVDAENEGLVLLLDDNETELTLDEDAWPEIELEYEDDAYEQGVAHYIVYSDDDVGLDDYEVQAAYWVDDTPDYDDL
jgi:hypothetical protein